MAITLTNAAASHIKRYLQHHGGGVGLRLGVKRTGCSGWAYTVDIAKDIDAADRTFEDRTVTVVVDEGALALIDGTEVDFVSQGLNRNFVFKNPNVTNECGCGESFTVDP